MTTRKKYIFQTADALFEATPLPRELCVMIAKMARDMWRFEKQSEGGKLGRAIVKQENDNKAEQGAQLLRDVINDFDFPEPVYLSKTRPIYMHTQAAFILAFKRRNSRRIIYEMKINYDELALISWHLRRNLGYGGFVNCNSETAHCVANILRDTHNARVNRLLGYL